MNWHMHIRQHPTLGAWYRRLDRPGWVWRATITTAVLLIVVPLALLTLAALAAAAAVFVVLSLVASGVAFLSSLLPAPRVDDGRRNVRVIQRP